MNGKRSWKFLGAGLLAGLVAALLMTLMFLLLRYLFGIATPAELIGDRLAAALSVETFLGLLNRFGGYNHLKQIGVGSVLAGQLVIGALGGLLYVYFAGRRFVIIFVGLLWLATMILLWPVLGTHYHGLPITNATFATAAALLFAYALYGAALVFCYRALTGSASSAARGMERSHAPGGRRALLVGGVGAVFAVAVGGLLSRLSRLATFSYDGTQYKGKDVQAITPNDRFYIVTKNVVDPEVSRSNWRLDITGLVEHPQSLSYEDLAAMPATLQETTLRCISNEVGGGLMSNAVWKGIPLRSLIERAGVRPGVVEVKLYGVDNYSDTFAFEKALDITTLVAYEMNGEPLPQRHGFPVRVIVPGLFGEKNVKWVTRIELVDHDAKGFYEQQGWGPNFVTPTNSRFDVPDDKQKVKLATVAAGLQLKGIAHAGNRGVNKVEVSADGGKSWNEAQINYKKSPLAWVLWSYDWRPTQAGEYKLIVRATDGKGELQPDKDRGTVPEGATGYHRLTVQLEA